MFLGNNLAFSAGFFEILHSNNFSSEASMTPRGFSITSYNQIIERTVWTFVTKSATQPGLNLALIPIAIGKIKNSRKTKRTALKNYFRGGHVQKLL